MTSSLRDVASGLADYRSWATDPRPRIGLGLPFFDKYTNGGLAKAECAMVMAYSSAGKTSVALNAIVNNPRTPTVFFSIEMSWRMVVARLAAISTGTPTWELEEIMKTGVEPQQITDAGIQFPVLLGNDQSAMTVKDMKLNVDDASRRLGQQVRLVIVDYLELIGGAGMLGKSEQVDKAAQKIRELAKDCDTSVIVLHQVGKSDGSGGHEALSLDSGKYGGHQPMDYVLGMYAPRLDRKLSEAARANVESDLYLQLLKNRSGKARPEGVLHHLDTNTGRLVPKGEQWRVTGPGYQMPLATSSRPDPVLN